MMDAAPCSPEAAAAAAQEEAAAPAAPAAPPAPAAPAAPAARVTGESREAYNAYNATGFFAKYKLQEMKPASAAGKDEGNKGRREKAFEEEVNGMLERNEEEEEEFEVSAENI